MAIHEVAVRFYCQQLDTGWAPGYLAGRGFSAAVQRRWQVGYAPRSRQALTRHLRAAGYRDALIVAAGLARRSQYGDLADVFRDRVMFPVRSPRGTVIGFTGRASPDAVAPKYLNSPVTVLYDKGRVLFGLWEARRALAEGAVPVIVEGPLDAIAVTTAGRGDYAAVTPCGTALTAHQVSALNQAANLAATGVLVAFDGDEAGRRAAVTAYPLLRTHTDRINAVTLPAGQDPAQILRDHGARALAGVLASRVVPLADLVIDAQLSQWDRGLGFAEGRIVALRAITLVIVGLPPGDVARQVARLAERLDLDHPTVTEAVTDALTAQIQAGLHPAPGRDRQHELDGLRMGAVRASHQDSPHRPFAGLAEPVTLPPAHRRTSAGASRARLGSRRVAG